jgi:GMP synthase (glutamine-hydrolysing)
MKENKHFLIIDGYPETSRIDLENAGMQLAWKLYASMLENHLSGASYDVLLPSDFGVEMPDRDKLAKYDGILWTGCNLSINDTENPSVQNQIELAKMAYDIGIPSFGSCWGLQISVVAAGGRVDPNPKGKEMGIARKITKEQAAKDHPMFQGKPDVYEAFISHDDIATKVPKGGVVLAGNEFTAVQALCVNHKKGTFWSTQYHPEYNLREMACLIIARAEKLIEIGFYKDQKALDAMVERMKELADQPDRKDLRWQLVIDDDVLDRNIRQCEFSNWINMLIMKN